jgi:hypothetical protein
VKLASLKTLTLALVLSGSVVAQLVTLSQSNNPNTITANNSAACTGGTAPNVFTLDTGYFRSYSLAAIAQPIDIVSIRFGVELVQTASPSGYPLLIRLYNDPSGGAPSPFGSLVLRKTESFTVPTSATNTIVIQPLTGAATTFFPGETLVVEINAPTGLAGQLFFIGSNAGGQTAPNYLRSTACGLPDPTVTSSPSINFPNMHTILDVNYVPQGSGIPYPGTNEDVSMLTGVNANTLTTGIGNFIKSASAGNTVTVKVVSSGNTFNHREFALIAQAFTTGNPPFPPVGTNIHMTFPGLTILIGGDPGPFGPVLLPPGGTTVSFLVPPGLNGQSVIFQGVIVTLTAPFAQNGIYASTNGHVFQIP